MQFIYSQLFNFLCPTISPRGIVLTNYKRCYTCILCSHKHSLSKKNFFIPNSDNF